MLFLCIYAQVWVVVCCSMALCVFTPGLSFLVCFAQGLCVFTSELRFFVCVTLPSCVFATSGGRGRGAQAGGTRGN